MTAEMSRTTLIAIVVCATLVAAVTAGTAQLVRRQRTQAIEEFSAERLRVLRVVAGELDKDFANIGEVLRFAAQVFATAGTSTERERELGALLTVGRPYHLALIYAPDGRRIFEAVSPASGLDPRPLYPEIDPVARRAVELPPGRLDASPPFTVDGDAWYRAFASSFVAADGTRRAVVLLVDTRPLFAKVGLVVSEVDSRLLVLGARGLPAPASAPELAEALRRPRPELRGFQAVADAMRAGGAGTRRIVEREATELGLPGADAVAAFAPVPFRGGHWSVATLTSTVPLRAREQAIILRLGVGGAAIALCLVGFAAFAVVATRRSTVMRERLAQATRLAHLHELNEKILDNVPTGVLALSSEGRIAAINRALRVRLPADPVGGDLPAAFPDAPPQVLERLHALVDRARETAHVQSIQGEHLALFGAEGQYIIHAVPLEPRLPGARVLLVVEDLSEVRALESRLLRAEKLATVGVLAAGIAHEIGTPLGVVRGRAEYMLGKLPAASPQAPGMRVIIDQIDRVARIIGQLLDFARLKPAVVHAAALPAITSTVVELLRFEAERRGVDVSIDIPKGMPPLSADPDQLQQVLVNLVMNACDACPSGGSVAISAAADGVVARVQVSDDGCGIPDEHRHQVFDPFFTTKKRGQGSGLGLAVAAQIVRNHGGDIEIESALNRGTRVTLVWPMAANGDAKEAARGATV